MAHLTISKPLFRRCAILAGAVICGSLVWQLLRLGPMAASGQDKPDVASAPPVELMRQSDKDVARKSTGCISCHKNVTEMHHKGSVKIGCVDCHGGNPDATDINQAHVHPRNPEAWPPSANPVRSYALLNHEAPEFIRFMNPGDLRIAHLTCGTSGCHTDLVKKVKTSMMTHGAMLWEAALYNNGGFPDKHARFGESYSMNGVPQRLLAAKPPTEKDIKEHGLLPYLNPLPKFEITQPGNVLRIFERGGVKRAEVGIPETDSDTGRPFLERLSDRGLGTVNRTDPVFLGLQKTRLLDPTLNFMGTNDHPGDYRNSGCTACHVVYANDRSPVHSGKWAKYGNRGKSFNADPTISKEESGHPIEHRFTVAPPTSQCMTCHIHPGTTVMNTYIGYMWWDNETDGEVMYPKEQKHLTSEEFTRAQMSNPDEASARGNWSDPEFLANLTDLNPQLKHTQFADFHGHGWVFRAVFAKDRKGNLRDHDGKIVKDTSAQNLKKAVDLPAKLKELNRQDLSPAKRKELQAKLDHERAGVPVHLLDIHMEKGMHCVDCHFNISAHGNGNLYGEVRNAVEIACIDCHGTTSKRATLKTSGNASPEGGLNLEVLRTPFRKRRFEREGAKIYQNSMVEEGLRWECVQVMDVITQGNEHYNEKARLAKTVRFEGDKMVWGDVPKGKDGKLDEEQCAHKNSNMSCIACHSSWNPTCYGCHLPQKANKKMPELHNAGDVSKNYISYNFQTLRDDVFMLARDGDVTKNKIGPARSSCAVHVGSYNGNRESIYFQQQTISSDGLSGIAFSTNVPHTVRGKGAYETKQCTDCHISAKDDNNAIMAQLLGQGTNSLNLMGRYCWVAGGHHGLFSVEVSERDEPQTVFGSSLHQLAFPDNYRQFVDCGRKLKAFEHPGKDISDVILYPGRKAEVLGLQNRGEYCYAACGEGGLRVFDISFVDHKGFSERIFTAPVSPLGQKFYVSTKFATAVAAPATTAPDPTRKLHPENEERPVNGMYAFIYVTDKYEGLILVGAGTLLDGNPLNNFLKRDVTFNPDHILDGARAITIAGHYAYICCDAGVVVVSVEDPKKPKVTHVIKDDLVKHPNAVQVQFRYAFIADEEGVKVFDITDLGSPAPRKKLDIGMVHNIYLGRTHAYCAAGKKGLVILDIEKPEALKVDQVYNADGSINDLHDVKLGITYVSQFAYLADGKNGMRIVQLTSPESPGNDGFITRPTPKLIATYKLPEGGHALSIAKGLDRDRAVDESGNQLSVFGRVGAGPFDLKDQHRFFLHNRAVYKVTDDPKAYGEPKPFLPAK